MATIKTSKGKRRLSAPKKTSKVKTKIIFRDREGFSANLQEKSITENGEVTPDEGYDGFSKVTVNVSGGSGGVRLYAYKFYEDGVLTGVSYFDSEYPFKTDSHLIEFYVEYGTFCYSKHSLSDADTSLYNSMVDDNTLIRDETYDIADLGKNPQYESTPLYIYCDEGETVVKYTFDKITEKGKLFDILDMTQAEITVPATGFKTQPSMLYGYVAYTHKAFGIENATLFDNEYVINKKPCYK